MPGIADLTPSNGMSRTWLRFALRTMGMCISYCTQMNGPTWSELSATMTTSPEGSSQHSVK